MALLRMELYSRCLRRTVPVTALVPVDSSRPDGAPVRPDKPFKTLYLLHGMYGGTMDWLFGSNIFMWAAEHNLAVVMPAGENRFYVDTAATGEAYGRFIGEELVALTRRLFPLSASREDTYIAGLSMGGFGALRNGLAYGDTFGYAAGLSSALLTDMMQGADDTPADYTLRRSYYEAVFGDLAAVADGDKDCESIYAKRAAAGKALPKMYMACGTEDFLLAPNRRLRDFLQAQNADFVYEEGPGGHDFDFWNRHLRRVLDWLPLEPAVKVF